MSGSRSTDERVVVIGSGPSGSIAARELVRAGVPVTMLESGTRAPRGIIVRAAGQTMFRWRSGQAMSTDRHVAAGDPATEFWSSLAPGGLSNYWTAAVPRYAPEDFTDGGRIDARFRWPIGYDDLAPFYDVAEELMSVSGPAASIPVLPAGRTRYRRVVPADWRKLLGGAHHDELTVLPLARGAQWMVAMRGSEFNSYHVIVRPLCDDASFELRLGAHVVRLLTSDTGDVNGVEYRDAATGTTQTIRARAVVVTAGTIDTARILLSSSSRSAPNGIGNEHGLVGRYLQDHPREWWTATFDRDLTLLDHPLYLARRAYASSAPLTGASATIGLAQQRDRVLTWIGRKGHRFGVQVFGTMVPDAAHAVRLSTDQVDRWGIPKAEIEIRYDDAALATLADMRERFVTVFADAGATVQIGAVDWAPRPGSSVHYAGAVRMHDDPQHGVLDAWNRVHTCPNVVVADLSCFTTNPEKNPTLTAMALAARAARHLATGDVAG